MNSIKVCRRDSLEEGQSLGFDVHSTLSVLVVKKNDQVFVYQNRCPHLGIRLEWQENKFLDSDTTFIECSTHGALFDIETGECIIGPCQGDALEPVAFIIKDNHILVELD